MAGLLSKVNSIADRVQASWFCGMGRISALYGAARLLQLPFAILGLAVGRAAFPLLIEQASLREGDGFSRAVVRALRLNAFLMAPATVGLLLLARPFVRLMFQRGAFTAEHTGWAAFALVFYGIGLAAMGARTVLSRAFYALLNTRTPFLLSAISVGVNVVLSVGLVVTRLGHGGLALATAAAAWLQASLLLILLGRELERQGQRLDLAGLWPGLLRVAGCAVAMALAVWGCMELLGDPGARGGLGARLVSVAAPGLAGLVVYAGAAVALRCEGLGMLLRRRR
jgi:putative peptidoglycan lipid II flippase